MPPLYKSPCFVVNKQSRLKSYKPACSVFRMDFANRLRQRRKFLKLTQAQLGEKSGLTQQMIQQLETRKVLTTGKMIALAGALGVRPGWLESGEDPMMEVMTLDERELLKDFRALEPDKKPIARLTIRAMTSPVTGTIQIRSNGQDPEQDPERKIA
jgi:transcriptional regulator with XRE-family HTH domain